MPQFDVSAHGEECQYDRLQHAEHLHDCEHAVAVVAICSDATGKPQEQDRDLDREVDDPQPEGRVGHAPDEPREGEGLRPRPDHRNQLAPEKEREIMVPKGAPRAAVFWFGGDLRLLKFDFHASSVAVFAGLANDETERYESFSLIFGEHGR